MLSPATFQAFVDELVKLGEVETKEIEKVLRPGDVLVTKPRPEFMKGKPIQKLLRAILTRAQGTEYTHSGMYVGDGKVIDSGFWADKKEVVKVPLDRYADRYAFRVLRVDATNAQKQDAVDYAKKQVGKPFSVLKMIRAGLPSKKTEPRQREALESMFCSELIANAYPAQPFAATRKIRHVRPVDLQRSPLTSIVGELK